MSTWYILGFLCGLILSVGVVYLLFYVYKRVSTKNIEPSKVNQFDERQQRYRGMAYKYSYSTLCLYLVALGCVQAAMDKLPGDFLTLAFLGIVLSITVFALICIRHDAYLSIWEKPKQIIVLLVILAIFNIVIGLVIINNGTNVAFLDYHYINLICGLMLVIILIYFIIRQLSRSKDEE